MATDYALYARDIELLLQLAKETKRDLSINIGADGEVNIEFSIPSRSISTYKLFPGEDEAE